MLSKNLKHKMTSVMLCLCLLLTFVTPAIAATPVAKDGVNDNWMQVSSTVKGNEINQIESGWRHLASETRNGNNPTLTGSQPAVFANEDFLMPEEGYFEFTLNLASTPANTRFGLYLNYTDPGNAFMLGLDAGGWFWQRYNNYGGNYGSTGVAGPATGQPVKVRVEWSGTQLTAATVNGVRLFSGSFNMAGIGGNGKAVAMKLGTYSSAVTDLYIKDVHYTGQGTTMAYAVSGLVKDAGSEAGLTGVALAIDADSQLSGADGTFVFDALLPGSYELTASKEGYVPQTISFAVADADIVLEPIALVKESTAVISSDAMDVMVDTTFPRVMQYTMKPSGKIMYGQTVGINTLRINDIALTPVVTSAVLDDSAVYTLTVKDEDNDVDAVLTANFLVVDNTLTFTITDVVNNLDDFSYPIQKIEIPNHSLVSVRSTDTNANFQGAVVSFSSTSSGDRSFAVSDATVAGTSRYVYGFVSNDQLSAGLWSSSEIGTSAGGYDNARVTVNTEKRDGYTTTGLGSSSWYYHRKISAKDLTEVVAQREMPTCKVAIADDENGDGLINWQDGAVAFRAIMENPVGYEEVPELVAQRIAMNFGGQAQNPFLMTLDNAKKVALNLDGLGQAVILKGYGSEGHDSAHPDFFDIGQRIGGADDMNFLMTEGKKLGVRFGIHINSGEMYPEAKAFSDGMVRRNTDGSIRYGWNWIDQAVGIDGWYDLITSERNMELARKDRLQKLYDQVGNNLSYVYLDIWGNGTSGNEDAWTTKRVVDDITSFGWRFVTEFPYTAETQSTFYHWATDLAYGSASISGHNSSVMRFLRNHQKDTWMADYASHSGAKVAPLLGGYNMKDFEGWQGRNNYNDYITNLFRQDVSTKFFQHYQVMQWENGTPVTMSSVQWTPEMKITLQDESRDNTVVIARASNDYSGNLSGYRSRTVTLNGKVILEGEMGAGNSVSSTSGNERYLIPWLWDAETGARVDSDSEKLYHFNIRGGTTTWALPDGWADLETVKLYELSDLGKVNEQSVAVVDGAVTLTAKASVPYVVYKGEAEDQMAVAWGVGMHIVDSGFNSQNLTAWNLDGDETAAAVVYNTYTNPMLRMSGEVSVSQVLTDLTPGTRYAAYVGVDNRSESKAWISVDVNGKEVDANYTGLSIAVNYIKAYAHSNSSATISGGGSRFQHMYVFFTAPESGDVTLTLKREAGTGNTYFDDIRIVESEMDPITTNEAGQVVKFEQDFEKSVQGVYPFVIGNVEGVEDNRTHLSELHAPYTQAGWADKRMDDVLDGNWSLKTNGKTGANNLLYQTIPQNFRFEPGVTYNVKFDYQMGSPGIYTFVIGNGTYNRNSLTHVQMPYALGDTATFSYKVTGAENGQTWVGLFSTSVAADLQGSSGSAQDFGGYKDLVLDNLVIERTDLDIAELGAVVAQASTKYELDYTPASWAVFAQVLTAAQNIMADPVVTQDDVDSITGTLRAAMDALQTTVCNLELSVVTGLDTPVPGASVQLSASNFTTVTRTADANGVVSFSGIAVRNYTVQVTATGYYTASYTLLTVSEQSAALKARLVPSDVIVDYVNTFDDGDISTLVNLAGNTGRATVTAVTHNGSGAARISFPGGGRNNIVDLAAPYFANGIFEADITPVGNSIRFGLVMRANDMTSRQFTGVGDSNGQYFWEYWNGSANSYSGMTSAVSMAAGTTYHMRVTLNGTRVTLTIDGTTVLNNVNMSNVLTMPGYIGFECRNANAFIIDNIQVSSYNKAYMLGEVTDASGSPLADASLVLANKASGKVFASVVSDQTGAYNLGISPGGFYTLTVSKDGYETVTRELSVIASNVEGAGLVVLESQAAAPVITNVKVTTPTIVETLAANLRVNVTGNNLEGQTLTAYLSVDGELLYPTDVTAGTGLMKIAVAPVADADCKIVVKVDGRDVQGASDPLTVVVYNPATLWNPALDIDEDDNLLVCFSDDIGPGVKGYAASVGGQAVACVPISGENILRLDVKFADIAMGDSIVVSGVKYPDLFPSYSFTFTISLLGR